jgi:S1-C subfamily serine protease
MPPPPPPRNRGPLVALIGLAILALLIGVGGAYLLSGTTPIQNNNSLLPGTQNNGQGGQNQNQTAPNNNPPSSSGTIDKGTLAAQVDPAIVDINTTLGLQNARAAGTGIVLTSSGLVLTNNHVIQGATDISAVDIGDNNTYSGTVVGYSTAQDIAVIQLANASGLATATLGDSSSVQVGDPILALGNAGGVGGTPTAVTGSVAATDRSITATDESGGSENLTGLIEIMADIEPGDSGGPLVNAQGQVVGIDTAASSDFALQASGGRGFAIPIDQAKQISDQIIARQASAIVHIGPTAFIGILTNGNRTASGGAAVAGVVPDSPADQAGIQTGDAITSLDGTTVADAGAIGALMIPHHPGDRTRIGWVDGNGRSHSATITLGEGPPA